MRTILPLLIRDLESYKAQHQACPLTRRRINQASSQASEPRYLLIFGPCSAPGLRGESFASNKLGVQGWGADASSGDIVGEEKVLGTGSSRNLNWVQGTEARNQRSDGDKVKVRIQLGLGLIFRASCTFVNKSPRGWCAEVQRTVLVQTVRLDRWSDWTLNRSPGASPLKK
jgi:hypothetical protein